MADRGKAWWEDIVLAEEVGGEGTGLCCSFVTDTPLCVSLLERVGESASLATATPEVHRGRDDMRRIGGGF